MKNSAKIAIEVYTTIQNRSGKPACAVFYDAAKDKCRIVREGSDFAEKLFQDNRADFIAVYNKDALVGWIEEDLIAHGVDTKQAA